MSYSICALLTCHNRQEKTRKCLESLFSIIPDIDVYLVDDSSTDGTADMVKTLFPQVILIHGDGNLFWNRGMHKAWVEAMKHDDNYDFTLWLNDDVELFPFFLDELLACHSLYPQAIISGLIEDMDSKHIIYGGSDETKRLVQASDVPQPIHFMNGNVVLVPKTVSDKIGILDPVLHHDLGDVDYGLTAQEHGIQVFSTRKAVAGGYRNDICRVRKWGVSIGKRFKVLYSPLGSHPRINFYFRKKHFGFFNASAYWIFLHTINIMPDWAVKILFGETYMPHS